MSMSMSLEFFRAHDDPGMEKMLDAAYACRAAGVSLSADLRAYLKPVLEEHGEVPEDRDRAVCSMLSLGPDYGKAQDQFKWSGDMQEGFEINLADLPEGTVRVRFVCSW